MQPKAGFFKPSNVLLAVGAWLLVTWASIVVIDFLNISNAQSWSTQQDWILPFLWWEIYREARYTENLQWLLLALATIFVSLRALAEPAVGNGLALRLLAAGLLLMFIEDSLNLRHIVADEYLPALLSTSRKTRMLWELSFYSFLSTLLILPLLWLWRNRQRTWSKGTYALLIAAYAVYGLVGFGSALRRLGDWQSRLGAWIIDSLDLAQLPAWSMAEAKIILWQATVPDYEHTLGYLLVDHLIEESVELIAAGLLLAAMLSLLNAIRQVGSQLRIEQEGRKEHAAPLTTLRP